MLLSKMRCFMLLMVLFGVASSAHGQNIWTAGSATDLNWDTAGNWGLGSVPLATDNVVFPFTIPNPGSISPYIVNLASPSSANSLSFLNSYTLGGAGSLNLTSGAINADFASLGTLNTQLIGSGGLTKTGYGSIILGNSANSFTGPMAINVGQISVNSAGALGGDTSTIVVGGSLVRTNGVVLGTGGTLALGGGYTGQTYTRPVNVSGGGNSADGQAFYSVGNNTISGDITFANAASGNITRISSVMGTTTFNNLAAPGVSGQLGQLQGSGNFVIAGITTIPTGAILEKQGATTQGGLNITGTFSGNGELRSTTGYIRLAATNGGIVLSPNGGQFELRTDAPATSFNASPTILRGTTSGNSNASIFADHAAGSIGLVNSQIVMNTLAWSGNNTTHTFTSRNGFGLTFSGTHTLPTGNNNAATLNSNTSGTVIFNVFSLNEGTARTLSLFGNGDQRINGNFAGSGTAQGHNISKQGQGFLTLVGTAPTANWSGTTTISNGTLSVPRFSSLTSGALVFGNATTSTGALVYTGTSGTGAGETSGKAITWNSTTGNAYIYANQAGSAPTALILNGAFTASLAGTKTFFLAGSSPLNNEIAFAFPGTAGSIINLQKAQLGTWVLSGANLHLGTTNIAGGTLTIQDTFSGASRDVLPATATGFNTVAIYQNAGGTLRYSGAASAASIETTGNLVPAAGEGKVVVVAGAGGTASFAFAALGTVSAGATVNFDPDASSNVTFNAGAVGFMNKALFFQNTNYAYLNSAPGIVRAPVYDTDAGFVTASTSLTAASHNNITGSFSSGAVAAASIRFDSAQTLTLTGTLSTQAVLATNGNSTIAQGTGGGISTGGANELVIRVAGASDVLNLNVPILAASTLGVSKSGLGTVVFGAANAQTTGGPLTINEGTVRLATGGTLGANNTNVTIRQAGVLDLAGVNVSGSNIIGALNGSGQVTNSAASGTATLTIGGTASSGVFMGQINNGATASIAVVKVGTGDFATNSAHTFTGPLTLNAGNYTTLNFGNIGTASGIGRGDPTTDATNAASLVFNGGNLRFFTNNVLFSMQNTPSISHNRLFTLAGNGSIDSAPSFGANVTTSLGNNAAWIWANTAPVAFSGTGDRTLTLLGNSTGDNEIRLQLVNNPNGGVLNITKAGAGLWHLSNVDNSYTGITAVQLGTLQAVDGDGLPANSPLTLGSVANSGVFQTTGNFIRPLAAAATAGSGTVTWTGTTGGGGFASGNANKLVVAIGGLASPTALTWGAGGFVPTGAPLILGSDVALGEVEFRNPIDLGAVARTITVNDNVSTLFDTATLSGVLSGSGGGIIKAGNGYLNLVGANTYTGDTALTATSTFITSFGGTGVTASSLGGPGGRLLLGSGTNTVFVVYAGTGETSDRSFVLAGTTGSSVIEASGTGPLVLTNVSRTAAGAGAGSFQLFLRGTNTQNNTITSVISNDTAGTGITTVTKDSGATWILSGNNTYTGNTNLSTGILGAGSDTAFGTGTLVFNSGSLFSPNADRTMANNINLGGDSVVLGNFAFNFTGTLLNTGGSRNLDNYLPSGKTLTFSGLVNLQDAGNNRTLTVRGTGTTIFSTTVQNGGTAIGTLTVNGADAFTLILGNPVSGNNSYTGTTTISRGRLVIAAANEQIPNGGTVGTRAFVMSPAAGTNATLDLNGFNETVNAFTATSAGNTLITNTAATPVTFTIGDADGAATFGSATLGATYTITNGVGALSLVKTGAGAATFTSAVNATYTGSTTVNAGSLTIAGTLNGTSGLAATGGSLNLNGTTTLASNSTIAASGTGVISFNGTTTVGTNTLLSATGTGTINVATNFTNPAGLTSVTVDGGATLAMTQALQLTPATLNLGSGSGIATLNFGLGANTATSSNIFATGAATTANTIRFNITGLVGFGTSATYDLLTATGGLDNATYVIGAQPFGYTLGFAPITPTLVQLTVAVGAPNTLYWTDVPTASFSWAANSGANFNWSTTVDGLSTLTGTPGAATTVRFSANNATATAGVITTTLDGSYSIDSLQFNANPVGVTSVVINPGLPSNSKLVIAPASSANGITIDTLAGNATINGGVQVNAPQTWTVTDATSILTVGGELSGSGNITKSGAGSMLLRNFTNYTGTTLTLNAGTLGLQQNTTGNGQQVPFSANIVVGGNATIDVTAPFVSTTSSLGNQVTFGGLTIGTNTLTITGGSNVAATGTPINTGYSLRANGPVTISGNPTFQIGTTGVTTAAGLYLAGVVTAPAATVITVNGNTGTTIVPQAPLALLNTGNSIGAGSSFVVGLNGILEGRVDESGNSSLGNAPVSLTSATLRIGTVLSTPITGTAGFSARYINTNAGTNYTYSYLQPALATQATNVVNAPNNASVFTPGPGMAANPPGLSGSNIGIHFSGVLNITTPGYYGFRTQSDDGSLTFINGSLVNYSDQGHGFDGAQPWGTIFLAAGQHTITETFGQGTGGVGVILSYTGPDTGGSTVLVGSIPGSVITPASSLPTVTIANALTVTTAARLEIATSTNFPSLAITNAATVTVTSNGVLGATLTSTATGNTVMNGNTVFNLLNANLVFAGAITENVGPFNLTKNGWGSLTVNGATYNGTTLIEAANFTSNGVFTSAGSFTYGLTNTSTAFGNVTFNDNASTGAFTWQAGRTGVTHGLFIANNRTLTINGNFLVGSNINGAANGPAMTNLVATGGGSLVVTGAAANVRIGTNSAGTNNANGNILDLSALASSTFTLGTGSFVVGFQGDNVASTNEVRLAPVSSITAATLWVGASSAGGSATGTTPATITSSANLVLGATSNTIAVNTLNIGSVGTSGRDMGQIIFNSPTGTVTITDVAGTGGPVFNMGTGSQATGYIAINNFDVTGHTANITFGASTIGNMPNRTNGAYNYFAFDTGTLTMQNLTAAVKTSASGVMQSFITLSGTGTTTITEGILAFGQNSGTGTGAATANLTISGTANVTIGATAGDSIRMASSTTGLTSSATLNFNGGTTSVTGNIVRVGGAGTTTSTINLAGGTLIMNDANIGTATLAINNFNFTAGTLRNLGSMFQNVTQSGGTLERTTAGTTSITGSYTATSATTALVRLTNAGANLTTTGGLNINANATLRGIGQVNGDLTIGNAGTIQPGNNSVGTLTLNPGSGGAANIANGAILAFQIDDATTPAAISTGGSSVGTFPTLTSNSAFNQISGTLLFANGNTTTLTVVIDGTAATFTPLASYSYQVGAVAGQDLSTLSIVSPSLTVNTIGIPPIYSDYSLTGSSTGSVYLNFTVVPEPALLGLVVLGGLFARRRFAK